MGRHLLLVLPNSSIWNFSGSAKFLVWTSCCETAQGCCCCCSVTQSCPTFASPRSAACQASPSFCISQSLLKLMSTGSVVSSNHFILCHSLHLPSIFPSIRVFSNESALHIRWPKYWSFNFSYSPSNDYSVLISFRIDGFDFLAVQGTLVSLL